MVSRGDGQGDSCHIPGLRLRIGYRIWVGRGRRGAAIFKVIPTLVPGYGPGYGGCDRGADGDGYIYVEMDVDMEMESGTETETEMEIYLEIYLEIQPSNSSTRPPLGGVHTAIHWLVAGHILSPSAPVTHSSTSRSEKLANLV